MHAGSLAQRAGLGQACAMDPTSLPLARSAALAALTAHFAGMPPVAAMQPRLLGWDGETLSLGAPLAANVNDKGCAFGGSLGSLMTIAGWGVAFLQLAEAALDADIYVADSRVRYLKPVFEDLVVEARLDTAGEDGAQVARARRLCVVRRAHGEHRRAGLRRPEHHALVLHHARGTHFGEQRIVEGACALEVVGSQGHVADHGDLPCCFTW